MPGEITMKSFAASFRLIAVGGLFLMLVMAAQNSLAQTISLSPGDLSIGIPTGTTPPLTDTDTVIVGIPGTGTVTLGNFQITGGTNPGDFTIFANGCTAPQTAPATCPITVQFTSTQSAGVLETSTLSFTSSAQEGTITVPLNGAYGAIKLFDEVNVTKSPSTASFTNMYTIASPPLNLVCPASPAVTTATLSNTPDGSGYVLVDNYITLSINGNLVSSGNFPAGNVCSGGPADSFNGSSYNDCFSSNYQVPAGMTFGLNGLNPDTFTNPGNSVLTIQPPNLNNAGGLPPISLTQYFPSSGGTPTPVQATISALDQGYVYTASTLFLVSSCSLSGITPGGNDTGNPITADVASQTQTLTFDAGPGQGISYNTSIANAVQAGTVIVPAGTVPVITDIGVPQSLFSQLVTGTSAAPAVCLRLTGETDPYGQAMCKGYLVQCQFTDANGITTITGDNCNPTPSTIRNLFDLFKFDSPDAPMNGINYLYNSSPNACSNALSSVTGGACAPGTGPGLLMGSDNWLCAPGSSSPCTPIEPTTMTTGAGIYSPGNCQLTGSLTGDYCPLDTLTQFDGAADPPPAGTSKAKNSIFIPVANMPLPTALVAIAGLNANGWINTPTINATFTSNAASYPASGPYPAPNSVAFAPAYSLTYGLSPASVPLPDPTYPLPTDITNYNSGVNPNLNAPMCPSGTAPSFGSAGTFTPGEGVYNLHYFTTDCAYTEGLIFNPQGASLTNPLANWASWPVTPVGVDNVAPVLTCPALPAPNGANGWYTTASISLTCSATDDFSGFAPGSPVAGTVNPAAYPGLTQPVLQGSLNTSIGPISPTVPGGVYANAYIPKQSIQDLAGNPSDTQGPYATPIDTVIPTVAATFSAAGSSFNVGSNVNINYSCADNASGVASCAGTAAPACPTAPAAGPLTFKVASPINTAASQLGLHSFQVYAKDCAGNTSSPTTVSYTITAPQANLDLIEAPSLSITQGTTGIEYPLLLDLSSNTAYDLVVTSQFTVPAGVLNGGLSASYWVGPCLGSSCSTNPTSPVACSVSGTTISCPMIGQLLSVARFQGVILRINIPVLSTATAGTQFSAVTTVTSANASTQNGKQTFTVKKK
jgi:hypothetical protein